MVDRAAGALSLPDDWPADPDLSLALNRMGSFDWDLVSGLMHLDQPASRGVRSAPGRVRRPPGEPGSARAAGRGRPARRPGRAGPQERQRPATARTSASAAATAACAGPTPRAASAATTTGRPLRIIGIVRDATQELADSTARLEARRGAPPADQRRRGHHRRPRPRPDRPGRHRRAQGLRTAWSTSARPAWSWGCSRRAGSTWSPKGPRAPSCPAPATPGSTRSTR